MWIIIYVIQSMTYRVETGLWRIDCYYTGPLYQ